MRLMGRGVSMRPGFHRSERVKGVSLQERIVKVEATAPWAALFVLAVVLACGAARVSPMRHDHTPSMQEIREELAAAGNLEKVNPNVLDWYEQMPGESAILIVDVHVEYEREPFSSPHVRTRTSSVR